MFRDRVDAGRHLAEVVRGAGIGGDEVVVLGLPRGGVPVADEVRRALGAPLDVIVVRKLGVPFQPELAMGAIGEDGVRVDNEGVVESIALDALDIDAIEQRERVELERRARRYRGDRPRLDLRGRCVVIVDDGIATGSSAAPPARSHVRTARHGLSWPCRSLRRRQSQRSATSATTCSAWPSRSRSTRWASGTTTSPRRPTTRWSSCSAGALSCK